MKIPATSKEREALTRLIATSARLIVEIGRTITDHGRPYGHLDVVSAEFVDAVIQAEEP